jgi:hypothetical protein
MAWLDLAECGLRWLLCRDPPLPDAFGPRSAARLSATSGLGRWSLPRARTRVSDGKLAPQNAQGRGCVSVGRWFPILSRSPLDYGQTSTLSARPIFGIRLCRACLYSFPEKIDLRH